MNKGRLFLLCGIPGSGKSYFCEHNIKGNHVYVSRDRIRFALLEKDDEYFSKEKEVWKYFVSKIEKGLAAGQDVYADATHLTPASRAKVLSCIADAAEINAIYFDIPLDLALRQNRKRSGRAYVPEETIQSMAKTYQPPRFSEGYNHIWKVSRASLMDNFSITEELKNK